MRGWDAIVPQLAIEAPALPGVSHVKADPVTASIRVLHGMEAANVAESGGQHQAPER